jgi:molybdopterin-guanine dinucleotide biosynthesis protein A
MTKFAEKQKSAVVDFPVTEVGGKSIDPFFNVNTPEELQEAEGLAAVAEDAPAQK